MHVITNREHGDRGGLGHEFHGYSSVVLSLSNRARPEPVRVFGGLFTTSRPRREKRVAGVFIVHNSWRELEPKLLVNLVGVCALTFEEIGVLGRQLSSPCGVG